MNPKAMAIYNGSSNDPVEAHLWVCSGKNVGRRYPINKAQQIIGRAPNIEIMVDDERASQEHAKVIVLDGKHCIYDLQSTNGTFVNNQRISEATLRDGDLVQIGETIFEYLSFEERTMSSTLRGTQPDSESVPDALRAGAQQALRRVRRSAVEVVPPGGAPNAGATPGAATQPAQPGQAPTAVPPVVPPGGAPPAPGALAPMGGPPPNPYAMQQAGMYPPNMPAYPHYQAEYYDDDDDDEDEGNSKPKTDPMLLLARVKTVALLYLPYWPMAIALAFVGVMLGALNFKMNPPAKKAIFQIILNPQSSSSDLLGLPSSMRSGDSLKFFQHAVDTFKDPPLIEAVFEKVTGKKLDPADIEDFKEDLDFWRVGTIKSNYYGGHFKHGKPEFALRYLKTHLNMYLEREVEIVLRKVRAEVEFLTSALREAEEELSASEHAVATYKAANPNAISSQVGPIYSHLFDLGRRKGDLEKRIAGLKAEIVTNARLLKNTPKLHRARVSNQNHFAPEIRRAEAEIAAKRAAGLGEAHPDMVKLKAKLAELKALAADQKLAGQATERTLNATYSTIEQALVRAKSQLKASEKELEEIERQIGERRKMVADLPAAEAELEQMQRNLKGKQDAVLSLSRRLKNAELQLKMEEASSRGRYTIVNPPRLEEKSQARKRQIQLAAGGIGGLVLAFAAATLILLLRKKLTLGLLLGKEDHLLLAGAAPAGGAAALPPPPTEAAGALPAGAPTTPPSGGQALLTASSSSQDTESTQVLSPPKKN